MVLIPVDEGVIDISTLLVHFYSSSTCGRVGKSCLVLVSIELWCKDSEVGNTSRSLVVTIAFLTKTTIE